MINDKIETINKMYYSSLVYTNFFIKYNIWISPRQYKKLYIRWRIIRHSFFIIFFQYFIYSKWVINNSVSK